ncbi:MAG: hypothetical protein NC213_09950 [Acetobacter sp.]|nr:hypothetical protein [Bacteroides sp.]MCM1342055.1 hypothetical protein [Acetobacter sp.]MCM1434259.1 hypothetical protein [Clostridiales bacterium]
MNKFIKCSLQLFADGSEGSAQGTAETATGSIASSEASSQVAADNGTTATDSSSQSDAGDKKAAFESIINGEYKSEYQAALEKALGKRIKSRDAKIAEYDAYRGQISPLLDKLAVKYGIDDVSDISAIMQAAEQDDSYYEEYALRHGVDVKTAKQIIKAERITKENERIEADRVRQQQFNETYSRWMQQAETTKQKYPGFDFDYESSVAETAEDFRRLLNSGVDVETAYTVIHRNEIMGGAMQFAYNSAQQEIADKRTARSARVNENGTSSQQASAVTDDWTKISKSDREKIKAAVRRGEKVSPENFREYL